MTSSLVFSRQPVWLYSSMRTALRFANTWSHPVFTIITELVETANKQKLTDYINNRHRL